MYDQTQTSTPRRIAKNIGWLFFSMVSGKFLSLLLIIYVARKLGAVDFGKFAFAASFASIFVILSNFGLTTLTIREVARERTLAGKYLGNFTLLKLILSLLVFSLIWMAVSFMGYPHEMVQIVCMFGLYFIVISFASLFKSIFIAYEKMKYESITNIIERIMLVSFGCGALYLGYGLVPLVNIYLITAIFYMGICIFWVSLKFARPRFEVDFKFWAHSLKTAYPLVISNFLLMIFLYIDTVMLSKMKGNQVVGWYNASFGLVYAFRLPASIFLLAIFPVMSKFFVESRDSLKKAYEKSFKALLALGLPVCVGGFLLAGRIIHLLYGQEYTQSIVVFKVLIWATCFIFLNSFFGYFFVSIDQQKRITKYLFVATVINVLLNLLLIPPYGHVGAGIATVVSEVVVFALCMSYIANTIYHFLPQRMIVKSLLAGLIMGAFVFYFEKLNLFILIVCGGILYFIVLCLVGYFSKEDRSLFKEMIGF